MESEAMNQSQPSSSGAGRLKRTVSGVQSGAVNVCGVTGAVLFATSIILFAIVVPILMIVIGARNVDECQAESLIPVYLIVAGTLALILVPISALFGCCLKSVSKETGGGACFHFCMALFFAMVGIFSLIWFICGNVWVFRTYEPNYENNGADNYCDELTYKFSFWIIIATYICSLLSCCCSCCFQRRATTYEDLH